MGESRAGFWRLNPLWSQHGYLGWLALKTVFHSPSHYPLDLHSTHMLFLIASCILRDEVNDLFMAKHSTITYSKCCELYFWLSFGVALAFRYKYKCLETTLSIFVNNCGKISSRAQGLGLWILDCVHILGMNSFFWTCLPIQLKRTVFYPHNSQAMIAQVNIFFLVDWFCCSEGSQWGKECQ